MACGVPAVQIFTDPHPDYHRPGDTADKVFALMLQLARERGTAFVLVTHDERIATRSHRVLHMRDGLIEREVVNPPEGKTRPASP